VLTPAAAHTLANYKSWADEQTFQAVAALPPGEAQRERPTLFTSIIGTLNHSYVVDLIWQAHLQGRKHGFTSRRIVLHGELEALRQAQRSSNQWLTAWCRQQTDATLAELVTFQFMSGAPGRMSRGAILLHIVNHATYHRGWVSDLFFQVPARPASTDFCAFPPALMAAEPDD